MRIAATYSHLNGLEFLLVHHPQRWNEIQDVVAAVDADKCRTKKSRERRKAALGLLYSPIDMNNAMRGAFRARAWTEQRTSYWVTEDVNLIRKTINLKPPQQKAEIEGAGHRAIGSYNQPDFVKDRIAVESSLTPLRMTSRNASSLLSLIGNDLPVLALWSRNRSGQTVSIAQTISPCVTSASL
jgi:hypothetical protein